jgi:hypothetical protein
MACSGARAQPYLVFALYRLLAALAAGLGAGEVVPVGLAPELQGRSIIESGGLLMPITVATMHTVRRRAVRLGQPYADAIRRFEELVPVVDAERFFQLDSWDAVVELSAREAPLGFMRYWKAGIASVGRELDEKVAGVLAALGAEPPMALTRPATATAEGVAS